MPDFLAPRRVSVRIVAEETVLGAVSADDLRGAGGLGRRAELEPASPFETRPDAESEGGGAAPPRWNDPRVERSDPVVGCRAGPVWHLPRWGAAISTEGEVYASTAAEARNQSPDLSRLPGFSRDKGEVWFEPPARAPRFERATAFNAFGGAVNYGHFVLDCLTSLLALEEVGLTADRPALAPPLSLWHRELLSLGFGDRVAILETPAPVVAVQDLVFATSMDCHLHAPGPIVDRLRRRLLSAAPAPSRTGRRVYLSRRGYLKRKMIDEAALEAALIDRGFDVLRPERLTVAEQVALMRETSVLVGPSGAALTNAIFLPDGAKVIEIAPENFAEWWVRSLCRRVGLEWHAWWRPSPLPESDLPLSLRVSQAPRKALGRLTFAYRVDPALFLPWLDERL